MKRLHWILLWLAAPVVSHANAQAIEKPGCTAATASRFSQAQTLYRSGQFIRALPLAQLLSDCFPDNVDYEFLRALTLNALGRTEEALAAARAAQVLAPDYTEVTELVARLEAAKAALPEATANVANEESEAPTTDTPEDEPAKSAAVEPRNRWSIIAIAGGHDLTDGRDSWSEASLVSLLETPNGRVFEFAVDHESRGDASDMSVRGNVVWPLGDQRRISTGVMLTPSSTFRPEQLLTLQFEQDLPDGWVARAAASQRSFSDDSSQGLLVSVDRYYSAFRFSFGVNLARLESAGNALSQVASVDWYRDERNRFRLTVGSGKELDTIADGTRVLESRVRSLTLTGFHEIRPRLAIGWWLGTLEQGDFYDRHYAGFSVTRRY